MIMKRFRLVAGLGIAALALAACGGGQQGAQQTTSPSVSASPGGEVEVFT